MFSLSWRESIAYCPLTHCREGKPFSRMVNGQYAMLSRQDNENIYLMYSDMPTSGTVRS